MTASSEKHTSDFYRGKMEIEPLYVIVYNYNSDGVVLYVHKLFSKLCVGTLSEEQKNYLSALLYFPCKLDSADRMER